MSSYFLVDKKIFYDYIFINDYYITSTETCQLMLTRLKF